MTSSDAVTKIPNGPADVELMSPDGALRVRFRWNVDRFVHTFFHGGVAVADSVDGDGDQPWPPSPPLQQLSLETLDGRDVILGVGAAGKSHWSVSVEPIRDDSGAAGLKFDWACRTSTPEADLGTLYKLADGSQPTRIGFVETTSSRRESENSRVRLRPAGFADAGTRQWAYQVQLSE